MIEGIPWNINASADGIGVQLQELSSSALLSRKVLQAHRKEAAFAIVPLQHLTVCHPIVKAGTVRVEMDKRVSQRSNIAT